MPENASTTMAKSISEDLLNLVFTKCENAKQDLEKNWIYQIAATGISLGMVLGMGKFISKYFLQEEDQQKVFYILLPLFNLYFAMRLGFLLSIFSETRAACANLWLEYVREKHLDGVVPPNLHETNSYFELYHRKEAKLPLLVYSLFVPIVIATGHASSVILLGAVVEGRFLWALACLVYSCCLFALYIGFYAANKYIERSLPGRQLNLVAPSIIITILLSVIFYFTLAKYSTLPSASVGSLAMCRGEAGINASLIVRRLPLE